MALLHKFFFRFPGGIPGCGLLLLRLTLGIALLIQGASAAHVNSLPVLFINSLAIVAGILLIVGFLTPLAALLVLAADIFLFLSPPPGFVVDLPILAYLISISAAVVLLGPGAFSLDARLFARREIVIPDDLRTPQE